MKYDFLIVGTGLFGATCANILTEHGYKCLIIDKNDYIGGLCATERKNNIDIHRFGPHVFHTNKKEVWDFVNKFASFNSYKHQVIAKNGNEIYHLPFTLNTFYELFKLKTPSEVFNFLKKEHANYNIKQPENLEEQAVGGIGMVGYEKIIKNYSQKLWGKSCTELNINLIENLPIRLNWDVAYYADKYQGIPINGYTEMIDNMLSDVQGKLKTNFDASDPKWYRLAEKIIFTGPIDEFAHNIYDPLEWRTLEIETKNESVVTTNMMGTAVMNFTDTTDMLQAVEHKWFTPERIGDKEYDNNTYVSYIRAKEWKEGDIKFYPVNNKETEYKFLQYAAFIEQNFPDVTLGGRAGLYRPMSMSDTIKAAMNLCTMILEQK
jgi:UDP-galactopyranose mutase